MRRLSATMIASLGLIGVLAIAQAQPSLGQVRAAKPDPKALIGTWLVDLRPTPADPPSLKEFVVTGTDDGGISGTFYESEIKDGRTNKSWSTVHFAFTSTDFRGGTYNTAGRLVGDTLEGTTHSLGRKFLSVWTATRKPPAK